MNLTHLKYFKTVAEIGNMTQAAKQLYIAQPALSKVLGSLEASLGYQLFDRIGKSLVLNSQGKIFLKYVNQIFASIEDAEKELADSYDQSQNTVHVVISSGAKYFVSLFAELQREHPEIHFHISDKNDWDQPAELCIFANENNACEDNSEVLFREDLLLAVPADHPLSRRASVSCTDLVDVPFLATGKETSMRHSFDRYCEEVHLTPDISYQSSNTSLLKSMVTNGLGFALVPSVTWKDVEDAGLCKLLPISDLTFDRYIHVRWNDERYLTKACKKALSFLFEKHLHIED